MMLRLWEGALAMKWENTKKRKGSLRDVFWVTEGTEFFQSSISDKQYGANTFMKLWSQTFLFSALRNAQSLVRALSAAWHVEASPMLCSLLQ